MKLIDCSKAYDGQGAFRNGMHDRVGRLPFRGNLYRRGYPWASAQRFLWALGWLFQRLTGLGFAKSLTEQMRERAAAGDETAKGILRQLERAKARHGLSNNLN